MKKSRKRNGLVAASAVAVSMVMATTAVAATLGDADLDGMVSVSDAVILAKFLAGQGTVDSAAVIDFDGSGTVDVIDLTMLKRSIANITDPETPVTGDAIITAITYANGSVTLTNAAGETVDPASAANVTVTNNTYVTITQPGEYDVSGECANGQLNINCDKTTYAAGQVTCNLLGLNLANTADSPIYVTAIDDEFVLTVKNGYTNTISDGSSYTNADAKAAAIYSCDDMKIKGQGTLIVNGNCDEGIACKNDLKIWNGNIQVMAVGDAIRGKDSLCIGDPDETNGYASLKVTAVSSTADGLKSTDTETDTGLVRINGGTIDISAYCDGIQAEQTFEMNGGDVTIHRSNATASDTTSAKGIKAVGLYDETGTTYQSGGIINITGGTFNIDTSDDCLHSAGDLTITGGRFTLASDDDAIHSDNTVNIGTSGATVVDDVVIAVSSCYEGVEGQNINQYSGTLVINSTDDGYNAAGGADGSGNMGNWGGNWGGTIGGGNYSINLMGGIGLVNAADGDHDGIDSNGSLTISGGYFISNGNEPFDCDGTKTYSGGVYVINKGSGGMGGGMPGGSEMASTVTASCSASAGTRITLADASGNVILSFIADKSVSTLTAGCNDSPSAVFYTGGTVSGTPIETLDDTQQIYLSVCSTTEKARRSFALECFFSC